MKEQSDCFVYEFGQYRADPLKRRLSRQGAHLPLTSKAFETLIILVRRRGETVSKAELMDLIWADASVEENNLTQQISTLRRVFGETPDDRRFIVTVPGRGYSFVADVCERAAGPSEPSYDPPDIADRKPRSWGSRPAMDRGKLIGYSYAASYILLIALCFLWSGLQTNGGSRPQSLAVINFRADSSSDEFIGNGISDTLRARLGSVDDLIVRRDAGDASDRDVVAAGRRLQVEAVVTGSVQRDHDRIRVAVEMLDVTDGHIVWSKTFDDSSANLFALQDSIAGEIARVLNVRFISHRGTVDGHQPALVTRA